MSKFETSFLDLNYLYIQMRIIVGFILIVSNEKRRIILAVEWSQLNNSY